MTPKLSSLTVLELKSLCEELDLTVPPRSRKQAYIDAIQAHGGSYQEDIPEGIVVPLTPTKSMLTPRKTRRTAHEQSQRELRHVQREMNGAITEEVAEKEKAAEPRRSTRKTPSKVQLQKSDEASELEKATDKEAQTEEQSDQAESAELDKTVEHPDNDKTFTAEEGDEKENTKRKILPKDDAVPLSSPNSSYATADGSRLENEASVTPKRASRKRWSSSKEETFVFAEEIHDSENNPTSDDIVEHDSEQELLHQENTEENPQENVTLVESPIATLSRQGTFVKDTPSKYNRDKLMGIQSSSKPTFKASKTPNFQKIHERNQARMENIAEYSARKRDRMRKLVETSRQIREAGNTSRRSAGDALKTPLKNLKDSNTSASTTPSSNRKIFSDKVRSNRRFELLMKARGLPVTETTED